MEPDISSVVTKIRDIGGPKIIFMVLYGSEAKGENTDLSDIDIAVYYQGDKKERFDFRIKILGRVSNKFDIKTFQDLQRSNPIFQVL
ncbi:MAG TPA: nucleotidyltransferase domain-containing protein [Candidatus Methanoperedens sp.]